MQGGKSSREQNSLCEKGVGHGASAQPCSFDQKQPAVRVQGITSKDTFLVR